MQNYRSKITVRMIEGLFLLVFGFQFNSIAAPMDEVTALSSNEVSVRTEYIEMSDRAKIYVRTVQNIGKESSGHVILVHGIQEFGGRLLNVVRYFLAKGYSVTVPDLVGHGLSSGKRTYVDSFQTYVSHLDQVEKSVREKIGDQKLLIYGHSMGGLITYLYATSDIADTNIQGYILSSPALAIKMSLEDKLKFFVSEILPDNLEIETNISVDKLTSDPFEQNRAKSSKYSIPTITVKLGKEMVKASKTTRELVDRFTKPALLLVSDNDAVVDAFGDKQIMSEVGKVTDVTIVEISDSRHEIHNSSLKVQSKYFKEIDKFLEKTLN